MRVDGFVPATGTSSNNGSDVLSKLKPGDTIRAQVLENSGNELNLKLSDGSKVSASSMSPVDAKDGEFVNFVFKGTVDGKPVLEVVSRNFQPQVDEALENIKNTLTLLKLPVTDQNIELAQALKEQNVPITADSMSKIIDLVSKNTELKPDSAAFLTAANMSSDKNSIEKLQSLLAGRLKISNDIGELLKLVNGEDSNSTVAAKSIVVNNILEKLAAEMVSKGQNQVNGTVALNKAGVGTNTNSNNAANTNTANAGATNSTSTTIAKTSVNSSLSTAAANSTTNVSTTNINATNLATDAANDITLNNNTNTAANGTTSANINNLAGSHTEGAKDNTVTNLIEFIANNDSNSNGSKVAQQISNLLKGEPPLGKADLPLLSSLSSHLESMLSKEDMSTEEQLATKLIAKEINVAIFKVQGKEIVLDKVSSGEKNLKGFEDAVNNLKNLFVRIDHNSDEINPVKLYKDMDNALQILKSSIQQLPMAMREAAMNIANNLEGNVNFVNQLNNYSSYVQIPLSIFNQNTTGELYMLKKGSKFKKLDPSNMTILISLDSNNIGRIDTLLSIDKKNISTNFRLEDSGVFKVLKENHKQLYSSLLEKGYRLVDFTYRLMDEPINIVNFEAEAKKEFIKSPNNIDIMI